MTVVYLHIGTQKTGSTALQDFFWDNKSIMEEKGLCFPDFGRFDSHVGAKRNAHWMRLFVKRPGGFRADLAKVCTLAEHYNKIVLSDEGLWESMVYNRTFWQTIRDCFTQNGIECRIIVYLRRQDEYVYSKWAQRVKAGSTHGRTLSVSFREFMDQGLYRESTTRYLESLQELSAVMGRENLIVRIFEPEQFTSRTDGERTLFTDFLDAIGEKMLPEYRIPENRSNISLSGNVLEARRLLNEYDAINYGNYSIRQYFDRVQLDMKREGRIVDRSGFTKEVRLTFMQQFEQENRILAQTYLGRADGVLFYNPVDDTVKEASPYSIEEIIEVCARLIYEMQQKELQQQAHIQELTRAETYLKAELKKPPLKRAVAGLLRRRAGSG